MAMPGKISMSFGSKPAASGPSRNPPPRPPKRTQVAFHDDDEEDADAPRVQAVSHFDHTAGGAIDVNNVAKEKELLVIPAKHKEGWRDESRRKRQRSGMPTQEQADVSEQEENAAKTEPMKYGLTVRKKDKEPSEDTEDQNANTTQEAVGEPPTNGAETTKPTEDELALQALLGDKPKSTLTIPQISEQEAFERDYEDAPDEPTLDEYASVPVEEFGDAMLRGMGWKDGETFGKAKKGAKPAQPRPVEKRPALLGIGAKHDKAIAEELGSWGKGARGGKAVNTAFTPVLMRNKVTGELLTEEELKSKIDQEKFVGAGEGENALISTSERDKSRSDKSSRRHREDDSDYDQRRGKRGDDYESKHRSSRRDRSSSTDSRHKRRRRDDDYYSDRGDRDRRRREKDDRYDSKASKDHRSRDTEEDRRSERRDKEHRRRDQYDDRERDHRDKDRRRNDRDDDYDSERRDKERRRRARDEDYDYERRDKDRLRRDRDDDYHRKKDPRRDRER
jgi:hypothetical protein